VSRKLTVAFAVTISLVALAAPVSAAPAETHCAVRVIGMRATGEYETSAPVCRATQASAEDAARSTKAVRSTTSFTIGVHYDGFGLTGSSFSVVGDNCSGGWLNLSASWINKVSSTSIGCPRVRHFDGNNLAGDEEALLVSGNLSSLNNRTNSIQYSS
jgi:hypothetical protein